MASRIPSGNLPHDAGGTSNAKVAKQRQFADLAAGQRKKSDLAKAANDVRSKRTSGTEAPVEARQARLDRVEIKSEKSQAFLAGMAQHKGKRLAERQNLHKGVGEARGDAVKKAARIEAARAQESKKNEAAQASFASNLDAMTSKATALSAATGTSKENEAAQASFASNLDAMTSKATALSAATGTNGQALSLRSAVAGQGQENIAEGVKAAYRVQNETKARNAEVDRARVERSEASERRIEVERAQKEGSEAKARAADDAAQKLSASMSIAVEVEVEVEVEIEIEMDTSGLAESDAKAEELAKYADRQELGQALQRATEKEGELTAARELIAAARTEMEDLDRRADTADRDFAEALLEEAFDLETTQRLGDARKVVQSDEPVVEQVVESSAKVEENPIRDQSSLGPVIRPEGSIRDVAQKMIEIRDEATEVVARVRMDADSARLSIKDAVKRLSVLESTAGEQIVQAKTDVKTLTTAIGQNTQLPRLASTEEAQKAAGEIARITAESPSEALASQPFLSVETALRVLN